MMLKLGWTFTLLFTVAPSIAQTQSSAPESVTSAVAAQADMIPGRTLTFAPIDSSSGISISHVTSLPQCDTDGDLFLDMLDPKNLNSHTVVSLRGKEVHTYLPSAISDVHDITIFSFFASPAGVSFLVRGTKDLPGSPGPGRSPAGIAWSSYHTFVAEFKKDGSYKGSIQLSISYQLFRLAIFPSGEFLVGGYDQLNSTARLLLLSSSGNVTKTIDLPGSTTQAVGDAPYRSVDEAKIVTKLIGSLVFTPYNDDILVWRANSNDPVLDVNSGGGVREVPLQLPPGFVFADMIPSNDRWVGHFRIQNVLENTPYMSATYSYFELHPQDAAISSKLLIVGDVPQRLACESNGNYITYKVDKDNRIIVLRSN